MAEYIKKINLDFNAEYPIQTVFAKQLDESSRFLLIEPRMDGEKFDVRECSAKLYAKMPDDTVITINGTITDDGEISFELTEIIKMAGIIQCDVKLTVAGKTLSSCPFSLNVRQTILLTNRIKLYQNRVYTTVITIENGTEFYKMGSTEKLIFTVENGTNILIQKELTDSDYDEDENGYILSLSSSDTNVPAGIYRYDVALQRSDGELESVIPETDFIVLGSVTNI